MPNTTAKYAISRPLPADPINGWPATMQAALDWLDANIATAITTDPRPAPGKSGRIHRAADGTLSIDTGAAWLEIARNPHASRHAAGGLDPLTVTTAMVGADVPLPEIGTQLTTAAQTLPANGKWAWANGGLIDRTVYAGFFAAVGHAYNGGVDPGSNLVRLPDKRGRTSVGPDSMGGSAAAARLTVAKGHNNAPGQNGGAERHQLAATESGTPAHGHPGSTSGNDSPDHTHSTVVHAQTNQVAAQAGAGIGVFQDDENRGSSGASARHTHAITVASAAAAAAAAEHNNVQPYEVDNVIVRIA